MRKPARLVIAFVGMFALAVLFAGAPAFIQVAGWMILWLCGVVSDAPGQQLDLSWLELASYVTPILAYLAILVAAIVWVRRSPVDEQWDEFDQGEP